MSLPRRRFLMGGVTVTALAACSKKPTLVDPVEPLPAIEDRIAVLEQRHDAFAGVYAIDVDSGRALAHRADDPFAMCSTFKGYAAARVLQKSAQAELKLTDLVTIAAADVVPNSPITGERAGQSMTMAELCAAALQRSDNTAGNYLLRAIGGPQAITSFARTIGDDKTRLDRWETALNSAEPGDPRDTSTPRSLGAGYLKLLTGDALGKAERDQLEAWMRANQTSSMRAGLPRGWATADKTGSGDYGSTNDVGMAYSPDGRRVLLSFLTRSRTDEPKAESNRGLIAELTTLVLPYLTGRG